MKLFFVIEYILLLTHLPILSQTSSQAESTYNCVYSYDANGNITSRSLVIANPSEQSSISEMNISITYNAASSKATVSVTGNDTGTPTAVNVYDMSTNSEVDNRKFTADSYEIDLSAHKKGIYIIEAINGSVLSAQKISKR